MKHLFTLLTVTCLFFSKNLLAQMPPAFNFPTYKQDADATLSAIDYSKIPTGILYDRVYPIARLQDYNLGGVDTASYTLFLQASGELQNASYQPLSLLSPEKLLYYNGKASTGDTVRLGIINYQFNQIDPDADTNIVHYPQNYEVNGQYTFLLTKEVTISAALAEIAYTTNGTIVFKWADNNYINTNKVIDHLSVDFADGNGSRTIQPNTTTIISYGNKGEKFLTITTFYTNNSSSTNKCRLYVDGTNFSGGNQRRIPDRQVDIPVYRFDSENATAFQGYDETVASTGKGDVYTYLKSSNGGNTVQPGEKVTKPIIILDGIDPGNIRKGNVIYNSLLEFNGTRYLGDELTDAGNDLIILDFPVYPIGKNPDGTDINRDGGTDYIERNAMVLVKLIKDLNQTLTNNGSSEQITIIGPSMGGIITRYALAYMEQHNIAHNCKLYVSFDAPHLGANIPIGDQFFLNFAAYILDDAGAREKVQTQLNNTASKQLLIIIVL